MMQASVQKGSSVYCFLFLRVLRCFTSPGSLLHTQVTAGSSGVSPFGHIRVKGYLAPYRILSQPYHVLHRFLKPRHPPYTLCSCRERCTPQNAVDFVPHSNAVHRCTILSVRPRIHKPWSAASFDAAFVCLSGTKRPESEFRLLFGFLTRQTYLLRKPGMVCGIASQASIPGRTFRRRTLSIRLLSMQLSKNRVPQ